jgi:4-amino-4-deoxy-L-arabinose transferase-like glycosyltransferase
MTKNFSAEARLLGSRTVWVVALLAAILFVVANLPWQLDDYDQAKQAFTSFEMVNQGSWLYQTTPHDRVATKPPLVGWISAALFAVTRSWELAWRLPSLAAAIATGFLLFRYGLSQYGATPAVIGISAFVFNLLTPRLATLVRTDMPLAFVIFVIGVQVWNKIRKGEPWRPNDRLYIFFLLTAGMLIKGPVVWAFLLPGLLAFQFWRKTGVSAFQVCGVDASLVIF